MATTETLNSKKEQADKILLEINDKHNKVIETKEKCDGLLKSIQLSANENKRINSTLVKIKTISDQLLKELNSKKQQLNTQFINVNSFFEKKYLPLILKIENPETGIAAKINSTKTLSKEIEKESNLINKQYDVIKKQSSEYRRIAQNLKTLETSTRKIYEYIQDKKPKFEEILKNLLEIEKNVKGSSSEIKKLLNESSKDYTEISSLKDKSITEYSMLASNKEDSNNLLDSIREIYEIAAQTGLSGEFENRRNKLIHETKKWEISLQIVTFILLAGIIGLFFLQLKLYDWDLNAHNFDFNFYIRFLILSPIVYYIYFCNKQYEKTKKLLDKYSFKTTLAMSIKSHTELLLTNKHFQKEERIDHILEFIINGFNKIYNEPYSDDNFKLRLKLANIEFDIQNRIMDKIKQDIKKD